METAIARANKINAAIQQILPGIKANLEYESIKIPPEKDEIRALETDEGRKYGACLGTMYGYYGSKDKYRIYVRDAVGKLSDTGKMAHFKPTLSHRVAVWAPTDDDKRVLGPEKETYPLPEGWLVDGEEIRRTASR